MARVRLAFAQSTASTQLNGRGRGAPASEARSCSASGLRRLRPGSADSTWIEDSGTSEPESESAEDDASSSFDDDKITVVLAAKPGSGGGGDRDGGGEGALPLAVTVHTRSSPKRQPTYARQAARGVTVTVNTRAHTDGRQWASRRHRLGPSIYSPLTVTLLGNLHASS
jgi:hypothetical protein